MKKIIFILFLFLIPLLFSQSFKINKNIRTLQIDENNKKKILSPKLLSDIATIRSNILNTPHELLKEVNKVGVVIYFENFALKSRMEELNNFGVVLYDKTWIPPLEKHPYGFMLGKIPADRSDNILSRDYIKKMDSSIHQFFPNNN